MFYILTDVGLIVSGDVYSAVNPFAVSTTMVAQQIIFCNIKIIIQDLEKLSLDQTYSASAE